jgi:hypothetical protein
MMKPYEKKLLAKLLDLASDEFGNHGCNDFDLQAEGLLPSEIAELHADMARFNKTPSEVLEGRFTYDWFLMSYLADKIRKES